MLVFTPPTRLIPSIVAAFIAFVDGFSAPCDVSPCPVPAADLPVTLHDAIAEVDSYDFYPIGVVSDRAIPPDHAIPADEDFNLYLPASLTSAQYYNVVVHLMLLYFDCSPPPLADRRIHAPRITRNGSVVWASPLARWTCPGAPPCEANQAGCKRPAASRIRPCFKDDPPEEGCVNLRDLVLQGTSSFVPCAFTHANAAVSGLAWTACAATLGLDRSQLWDDRNILSSLSFMFNNNIPSAAAAVGGGEVAASVPVRGPEDLAGAAIAGFSFGSGYICSDFMSCDEPGLTNTALAAVAVRSLRYLETSGGQTHLLLQWETAAAAAALLGFSRGAFRGNATLSSSCGMRAGGTVCVWKVGDGGVYLGTADVYAIVARKLLELGSSKLVQLAVPDHLPRVYRTGLKMLEGAPTRITLYPALIPFDLNFPVTAGASIVNLYEGSPFLDSSDFGLYPDNSQGWIRNRQVFRWYELGCFADHGGSGYAHVPSPVGASASEDFDGAAFPSFAAWKRVATAAAAALVGAAIGVCRVFSRLSRSKRRQMEDSTMQTDPVFALRIALMSHTELSPADPLPQYCSA